jgi:hypothetical protein
MMSKMARTVAMLAVVFAFAPTAEAQENTIRICNDGNTTMWVATVRQVLGWTVKLFTAPDGYTHRAYGWYRTEPGECSQVWKADVVWSHQMWFTVIYKDRFGTTGVYYFEPQQRGLFDASNFTKDDALFCIPDGSEGFSMTSSTAEYAGQWCVLSDSKRYTGLNFNFDDRPTVNGFWQQMPFPLKWETGQVGNSFSERTYTFTVRPDSNVKVWWPLKKYANYSRSSISVSGPLLDGVPTSDGSNSSDAIIRGLAEGLAASAAKK